MKSGRSCSDSIKRYNRREYVFAYSHTCKTFNENCLHKSNLGYGRIVEDARYGVR